jgi:hypothetical protein
MALLTDEESATALDYVLKTVLNQKEQSKLISSLEYNGITMIEDLITLTGSDIDELSINTGLTNLVQLFLGYVLYRNDPDSDTDPIGNNWTAITRLQFAEYRGNLALVYKYPILDSRFTRVGTGNGCGGSANAGTANVQNRFDFINRSVVTHQTQGTDKAVSCDPPLSDEFVNITQNHTLQPDINAEPDVGAAKFVDCWKESEAAITFIHKPEKPTVFGNVPGPINGSPVAKDPVLGSADTEDSDSAWNGPVGDDLHQFFGNCPADTEPKSETLKPEIGLFGFADNARPPGSTMSSR